MQVLVVGKGGREHALCSKIKTSPLVSQVYAAPGNPGMEGIELVPIVETDGAALVRFAVNKAIDLVIIGPEVPLLQGLADKLQDRGIKVFGPTKKAAEIEGSKAFAKELMAKYKIPTAAYAVFSDYAAAKEYLAKSTIPVVIKADGLAAGKGVIVAKSRLEAEEALREMLLENRFGSASNQVVIEEYLEGEEFSLMALVNGETVIPLEPAQDHKRAFDNDLGPNTGGMGAYSPVPKISQQVIEAGVETILKPVAKALKREGRPFTGVLYAGLFLTREGLKVIEFNARLGDPETQVLLPRLNSDLVEVILQLLKGEKPQLTWDSQAVVGVVVADEGYPESCPGGQNICAVKDMDQDLNIFYGGVRNNNEGKLVTTGGRAFLVAASGATVKEAQREVYGNLTKLELPKLFYRRDIGARGLLDD